MSRSLVLGGAADTCELIRVAMRNTSGKLTVGLKLAALKLNAAAHPPQMDSMGFRKATGPGPGLRKSCGQSWVSDRIWSGQEMRSG